MKTLHLNKTDFINWMYSDNDAVIEFGTEVLSDLQSGRAVRTIKDVYESAGYIPFDLVLNIEQVKKHLTKEDIEGEEISNSPSWKAHWETPEEKKRRKLMDAL